MITGWVVYDSNQYQLNKWFAHKLLEYCQTFCEIKLIITDKLLYGINNQRYCFNYDGESISKPDFVIMRTIFPFLSFYFEQANIRVFNNYQTAKICNDKRLTYLNIKKSNIPIMDTLFFDRNHVKFDSDSIRNIHYPCVLKSASGHGGKEVYLIKNIDELQNTVSVLNGSRFLIQKLYYPYGQDLRIYVMGKKIIGSVLRVSDKFISNYSLGGRAYSYNLQGMEQVLIKKLLNELPFYPDFVGIDFLYSKNQIVFNEIEDVVGTRMLYDTTDIDAALLYTNYIKSIILSKHKESETTL